MQVIIIEGIIQAQHGHFVLHLLKRIQRHVPDPLGRRIGGNQIRVLVFQVFESAKRPVVLRIGHRRIVLHVIAVRPVVELVTEVLGFLDDVWIRHGSSSK